MHLLFSISIPIPDASNSHTDYHNNLPINFPASSLSTLQSNLKRNISPITTFADSKSLFFVVVNNNKKSVHPSGSFSVHLCSQARSLAYSMLPSWDALSPLLHLVNSYLIFNTQLHITFSKKIPLYIFFEIPLYMPLPKLSTHTCHTGLFTHLLPHPCAPPSASFTAQVLFLTLSTYSFRMFSYCPINSKHGRKTFSYLILNKQTTKWHFTMDRKNRQDNFWFTSNLLRSLKLIFYLWMFKNVWRHRIEFEGNNIFKNPRANILLKIIP